MLYNIQLGSKYYGKQTCKLHSTFKLKVIDTVEKCENNAAGHEYSFNEKLVRDWKKKAELEALLLGQRSLRVGVKPKLENKTTEWVLDKHLIGIGLSWSMMFES